MANPLGFTAPAQPPSSVPPSMLWGGGPSLTATQKAVVNTAANEDYGRGLLPTTHFDFSQTSFASSGLGQQSQLPPPLQPTQPLPATTMPSTYAHPQRQFSVSA